MRVDEVALKVLQADNGVHADAHQGAKHQKGSTQIANTAIERVRPSSPAHPRLGVEEAKCGRAACCFVHAPGERDSGA